MSTPLPHRLARRRLPVSMLALCATAVQAQQPATGCGQVGDAERFAAFHDNYALWHQMRNNGWTRRDEPAVRGQLSLKYSFFGCPQRREKKSGSLTPAPVNADVAEEMSRTPRQRPTFWQHLRNAEVFVSYTNRFDFYLDTRPSGPVINRISNPGIHLRLPADLFGDNRRDAWQISFEHMSDGQVAEPASNARDRERAQLAYELGEHHFFDTISRGMNYVAVQGEWVWDMPDASREMKFDIRAKVKHYVSSDSEITWGPLAGQGRRFADYERVKLRLGFYWEPLGRFELTTQLGNRGRHASHTLGWQYTLSLPAWNVKLPLYALAHFGAMNTLSNYSQRQDSVGFGLRLAY
jgi:hypothetical protein